MTTTIYFSGSITGGREDVATYRRIVDALAGDGHRVLAGAVAEEHVAATGETLDVQHIFARDLAWIDESHIVIADVSTPSHGVGYEIAYARHVRNIPVIALFHPGRTTRCSAMICGDPKIILIEYAELGDVLESIRGTLRYPDRLP